MDKALPPNNIQDNFLNAARRERSGVTIYLISGVKLTGRIKSFDKYSLILEAGSQEQLIFKHAISTVSLPRGTEPICSSVVGECTSIVSVFAGSDHWPPI